MSYITIEEIVGRSEKGYPQNVRKAVLSRLLKRGILPGKRIDKKPTLSRGTSRSSAQLTRSARAPKSGVPFTPTGR